jgi:hypothetical protein
MIRNPEMILNFEDAQVRQDPADYHANLQIFEALWKHAVDLGILPSRDPLDGLEIDVRLAEALNVR